MGDNQKSPNYTAPPGHICHSTDDQMAAGFKTSKEKILLCNCHLLLLLGVIVCDGKGLVCSPVYTLVKKKGGERINYYIQDFQILLFDC